jgi:cyclopropane-fatty-acyl-phospholipid synthase
MTSILEPTVELTPTVERQVCDVPPPPAFGTRARLARRVLTAVVRKVPVGVRLDDGTSLHAAGAVGPEITVHDAPAFFARMGQSPMIGLGEGYMAGDWAASPGTDLADALTPFAARLTDLIPPAFYRLRHAVLPRLGAAHENTVENSRRHIQRHYDLSNDMFALFLDPSLSYSSAVFETLDPPPTQAVHEQAQLAKIDAVLDAAAVGPGSRVLEIGTGWGSLAIRAAERGASVTTLTLSVEQAELARERISAAGVADRVEVKLQDYRDEHGTYDAVVSVEMIEAVGEKFWPTYFTKIDEVLAPRGRVAIQAIVLEHQRMLATRNTYGWIQKYIFPGGLLPSVHAIEGVLRDHTGLRVTATRRIGRHYAHTLRLWRERFLANWVEVEALGFDDTFRRMWEFYLAYCEAGFRSGYLDDVIFTIER